MEKYEMNGNIIITTKERYEKKFKDLGYVPYTEKKVKAKVDESNEEKTTKRKVKED